MSSRNRPSSKLVTSPWKMTKIDIDTFSMVIADLFLLQPLQCPYTQRINVRHAGRERTRAGGNSRWTTTRTEPPNSTLVGT